MLIFFYIPCILFNILQYFNNYYMYFYNLIYWQLLYISIEYIFSLHKKKLGHTPEVFLDQF